MSNFYMLIDAVNAMNEMAAATADDTAAARAASEAVGTKLDTTNAILAEIRDRLNSGLLVQIVPAL